MKRSLVFFLLAVSVVACNARDFVSNANSSAPGAALPASFAAYKDWSALFETPRDLSVELMQMCRLPNTAEEAYLKSEHATFFTQLYVNPIGMSAMEQDGARVFPQGTVIVKEKWVHDARVPDAPGQSAGLGVMVKREAGFDTQGNDWEYLFVDAKGMVVGDQKQMQECRACHIETRARDAVFYPAVLGK